MMRASTGLLHHDSTMGTFRTDIDRELGRAWHDAAHPRRAR
jgi:hypothetical protein